MPRSYPKTRQSPISQEKFVELWNSSNSVSELAAVLNRPRKHLTSRAAMIRSSGVFMKWYGHSVYKVSNASLLSRWYGMKNRCYDKKCSQYRYYGARGITVCCEWINSFDSFCEWALNNGYEKPLSLDRIDGSLGYSPENCRWVTPTQQAMNRKKRSGSASQYKGVTPVHSHGRRNGTWRAVICINGVTISLGVFDNEVSAAREYDRVAKENFAGFAVLNFPDEVK